MTKIPESFSSLFHHSSLITHHSSLNIGEAFLTSFDPERGLRNLESLLSKFPDGNQLTPLLLRDPRYLTTLASLLSGSHYFASVVLSDPEILFRLFQEDFLFQSRSKEEMSSSLSELLRSSEEFERKMAALRVFRKLEFLRIGLRDLMKEAPLQETLFDLSHVAEVCLEKSYEFCFEELKLFYGIPQMFGANGEREECEFAIFGMGKLGGEELNFSSDIDLVYLYTSDHGETTGVRGERGEIVGCVTLSEFFSKLSQLITRVIGEITPEGQVFRVDLRLRPGGRFGKIAHSLRACLDYYTNMTGILERQALIKAKVVAGSERLGKAFLDQIRPRIFEKNALTSIFKEIREAKEKSDRELIKKGLLEENIKLGPGGIREIEFCIQALQLLHAEEDPLFWESNSLKALALAQDRGYLSKEECSLLSRAYEFLRDLENKLQMSLFVQTHSLPKERKEIGILARKMGYQGENLEDLAERLLSDARTLREEVRKLYEQLFYEKVEG
ncbi:MAG: hypothetical protein HY731_12165 [Candidatus Tectomicrobia bacterium]|nr:hypothetical protein [Candidatus Tectomicrobia bacterium]